MKFTLVFLSVLAIAFSAPQPRKPFHDHVEEFLEIIDLEVGETLTLMAFQYLEFEEFRSTLDYLGGADFKNLIYEMESLPEFNAVVEFLENDNIDILYFIDIFNDILEQTRPSARQQISGKDFTSFINDAIAQFPKSKLAALFDEKMASDAEFRTAIDNLNSEEWETIWNALWENDRFKAEAQILSDNGIDLLVLLDEVMAIFGQN